jgi:uncharacterized protein
MAQFAAEREQAEPVTTAHANPAPLGLFGFALTTLVLSAANANLLPAAQAGVVIGPALFYGGLAQLLAGMWEFKAGNTFGATAFSTFGAFWLAVAATLVLKLPGPGTTGFGFFLLGFTIVTGLLLLGTLRSNIALIGVFLFLFLAFLALTIGDFAGSASITVIGGWLGIITAIIAWYTGLAGILAAGKSAFTLPVGPLS